MYYIPQPQLLPVRPSPLAGLGEGVKTLADAVIKSRERQALLQDYDLLPQILAKAQQLGQPETGEGDQPAEEADVGSMLQDTLAQMKTPQGKAAAVKLMLEHAPKPLYGYENGQLVQKGFMPKSAEILKPDPLAVEEMKQAGQEKREGLRQAAIDEREAKKQDWQQRNQADREAAWEARDQRRYNLSMALMDKRLNFQEDMKKAGTQKDRSEMARKEMLGLTQRAKESYNRRVSNIHKQFSLGGMLDEEQAKPALEEASREYQADLQMIGSAYGDVAEKYNIKLPGPGNKGPAGTATLPGGEGQFRLYNKRTGQMENVDQATYEAVKKREKGQ